MVKGSRGTPGRHLTENPPFDPQFLLHDEVLHIMGEERIVAGR